jgi:hypothetical protein
LLAEAAPARVGPQVHPLQLDGTVAEIAQPHRTGDRPGVFGDPERDVARGGVVEVAVELWIELEAELRQRVRDERAKARRVPQLERDDLD